jgi:hypothetical protein
MSANHHPPRAFALQKPWRCRGFFSLHEPVFRRAWWAPVSRRTDGADGRFSPGLTCRSMNRLVSSPPPTNPVSDALCRCSGHVSSVALTRRTRLVEQPLRGLPFSTHVGFDGMLPPGKTGPRAMVEINSGGPFGPFGRAIECNQFQTRRNMK